jgi:hypothetical protein
MLCTADIAGKRTGLVRKQPITLASPLETSLAIIIQEELNLVRDEEVIVQSFDDGDDLPLPFGAPGTLRQRR